MSDRSRKIAEEFKAKKEAERKSQEAESEAARIRDEKMRRDQKKLAAEAPRIWGEIAEMFATQLRDLNAEPNIGNVLAMRPGSPPNQIVILRTDEPRELHVTFDSRKYIIKFSGLYLPEGIENLHIKILTGDSEPSVIDGRDQIVEPEMVVELLLKSLLGL